MSLSHQTFMFPTKRLNPVAGTRFERRMEVLKSEVFPTKRLNPVAGT